MLTPADHEILHNILILLLAAIIAVPLVQRLRSSPILGYLIAGLVVGPAGLALIQDVEEVTGLAEFGVIFLLFTVGLDLPLQRLKAMWRYIFGLGLAQVALTSLLAGVGAFWFGFDPKTALVIGGALAFSSTATVVVLLREKGEIASRFGRVALAVLIFQDLAVVPLLAVLPLLQDEGSALLLALGFALLKAALALAIIYSLGRLVLRPLHRQLAATRKPEIVTAANLLIVLGTGWATAQAGMSMALGALLAGMLLAGTEYRHQVEADIEPFRGLLLGLFFISIGMIIDPAFVAARLPTVLALTLALLAGKALILGALGLLFGLRRGQAARLALSLAQGGEFAFVALSLALGRQIIGLEPTQLLIAAVTLTIALTPLLYGLGKRVAALDEKRQPEVGRLLLETEDLSGHFIVAGFGRLGRIVGEVLGSLEIPYVAVDLDPTRVRLGREQGFPVYFGDASRPEVLRATGLERAAGAMVVPDDPATAERIVSIIRQHHPELVIIARSRDASHGPRLQEAGANSVIVEVLEPALQLAASAMRHSGRGAEEIAAALQAFRRRTAGADPAPAAGQERGDEPS